MEIVNNLFYIWILLAFVSIPLTICLDEWSIIFAKDIDFIDREGENIIIRLLLCIVVFMILPFRIPKIIVTLFKQIFK